VARIEFYEKGGGLIVSVDDDGAPREGEFVNIAKKTWQVEIVTWAVDQPGGTMRPSLRANVELVEAK